MISWAVYAVGAGRGSGRVGAGWMAERGMVSAKNSTPTICMIRKDVRLNFSSEVPQLSENTVMR